MCLNKLAILIGSKIFLSITFKGLVLLAFLTPFKLLALRGAGFISLVCVYARTFVYLCTHAQRDSFHHVALFVRH